MRNVSLKDAKAGFSDLVDQALKGEFVTITRHGKPVAALVSVEAASLAKSAMAKKRAGFADYLASIPAGEFLRNPAPSRAIDL